MYRICRLLCATFVCTRLVSAAPQDAGSDLTFVKPLIPDTALEKEALETIPLTKQNESSSENQYTQNESRTTPLSNENLQYSEIPQYNDNQQYTKNELSTVTYETSSVATEKSTTVEEIVARTYPPRVKSPSPRFISKLGYFKNSDKYGSAAVSNFIERTAKRKFKSRCRCEKITNCPKLQITVPRCPEEYFLCC